jgi:DNA mismatch repair protein MutL
MAGKIRVLPESVAQVIAAGEVVERPSSVVKELMENAMDAGSSKIVVELKAGGLQLIRVQDDGEGIEGEEVPTALQRYATSKIKGTEDLYSIHTLGFRGEALPSIASVSHLTLRTRVAHSLTGTEVVCEGGEIEGVREIGSPVGTEVEVRNLFYNVPVKRKFLKSIRSELRQVLSQFLKLSLSAPSISFKFIHDGRILHDLVPGGSGAVRLEAVLGREIYEHLEPLEFEDGEMKISGFASLPSFSRGNADGIYLYVNGRCVKDRLIYKAITEAYRRVVPEGRFPAAVLFVTVPPSTVDVNVHPTKSEVKFRDPERLFHTVNAALRSLQGPAPEGPGLLREGGVAPEEGTREAEGAPQVFPTSTVSFSFPYDPSRSASVPWENQGGEGQGALLIREAPMPEWETRPEGSLRLLGQVYKTYLLCETETALIFIDQHAAHERLLFEKYREAYRTNSIPVAKLLFPVLLEVSAEESFLLESSLEEFQAIGFEIDGAGERTYAVRSVPAMLDQKDLPEIVREILHDLSSLTPARKGAESLVDRLLTAACHAAIRAHAKLSREEIDELMKSLARLHRAATCPHGRPIFFFLSRSELNKQFKR